MLETPSDFPLLNPLSARGERHILETTVKKYHAIQGKLHRFTGCHPRLCALHRVASQLG